jgi:hypothetical protein
LVAYWSTDAAEEESRRMTARRNLRPAATAGATEAIPQARGLFAGVAGEVRVLNEYF